MRHSIHVMFGEASSEALLELRRYVAMYSDSSISEFFTALNYVREDNGTILIQKVVKKPEERITFSSNLNDQWISIYEEAFKSGKKEIEESLQGYIYQLWEERINTDYESEDPLHFCLYVPLYLPEVWKEAMFLIKQIKERLNSMRVDIDIIGIADDLADKLDPKNKDEIAKQQKQLHAKARSVFDEIIATRTKKESAFYINNFVVIQNRTNKRSLEFSIDSLISVFGEFALVCIEKYESAFGSGTIDKKDVQGVGMSMLSFDIYYFQEYLLQDSFIKILEREKIEDSTVELTWAAKFVDDLLKQWLHIYTEFYRREIVTRQEQGVPMTDIMPEIHPLLENKFEEINNIIVATILHNEVLSLPQKKALLAVLLGQDDQLFSHGTLINSEQSILIDLERECINFFVEENNALLDREETKDDAILPPYSQLVGQDAVKDEDGNPSKRAKLPTDELKELRFRERNIIANIREMEDELADLKKNLTQLDESKKCLIEGGKIIIDDDKQFQLLHHDDDIVPLEDKYEPHTVTTKNIDISNGFTEIKNQGPQGACMSFSMVSVFEYFMKKNRVETPDLSEQFLYYNARKRTGREQFDEGSNSVASIQTLCEEGICVEDAWPYNTDAYATEPSKEAYKEAQRRRVKRAVMVEKKIEALKSALDDGLPVVFAVDLFPSFVKGVNGFISMPTDEEIKQLKDSGENHSHAMVLCGFNDKQQVFKVRNSWGKDFGDSGYCYLSYDYIMQYGYWDCVAIQEIELAQEIEGDGEGVERIVDSVFTIKQTDRPELNFSETDMTIRYALRKNFLDRLKKELKDLQEKDTAIQHYYESVKIQLRSRNQRDRLYQAAKLHREVEIQDIEKEKEENLKQKQKTLRDYDKSTFQIARRGILSFLSLSATFGAADKFFDTVQRWSFVTSFIQLDFLSYFISNPILKWLLQGNLATKADALHAWIRVAWILFIIGAVLFGLFYVWRRLDNRKAIVRRFDEIHKALNARIVNLQYQLEMLESQFLLAGDMISGLSDLINKLHQRYIAISNFVINLQQWLNATRIAHSKMRAEARAPFVSLIQNDKLEEYFQREQESIVQENNVWRFIENYEVSEEGIVHVQQAIKEDLLEKIKARYATFSIADYLINLKDKDRYPYLTHEFENICDLFKSLDRKSDIFLKYEMHTEASTPRRVMFIRTMNDAQYLQLKRELRDAVDEMALETVSSPYKIIFFTKRELEKDQVVL